MANDLTEAALGLLAENHTPGFASMSKAVQAEHDAIPTLVAEVLRRRLCPLCEGCGELGGDISGDYDNSYCCPACQGAQKAPDAKRLQEMIDRCNTSEGNELKAIWELAELRKYVTISSRFLKMACAGHKHGGDGTWDEPGIEYGFKDEATQQYWVCIDGMIGTGPTREAAREDSEARRSSGGRQ
jgi:hypothetical protein